MSDTFRLLLYGAGVVVTAKLARSILVNWLNVNIQM
jgi:hypothetical protein